MILHRCFPWDRAAAAGDPGGPLWFPRGLQGDGRHDAPDRYGCLYASERPVAAVVEALAPLLGTSLGAADLVRAGLPLALAVLRLGETAELVDLDDPAELAREGLRPSLVATRDAARSQADARALHDRRPDAAGIRWWSTFEPEWAHVTLFERAAGLLAVEEVRPLRLGEGAVGEAAAFLGLPAAA